MDANTVSRHDEDAARRNGVAIVILRGMMFEAERAVALDTYTGARLRVGTLIWVTGEMEKYHIPIVKTVKL